MTPDGRCSGNIHSPVGLPVVCTPSLPAGWRASTSAPSTCITLTSRCWWSSVCRGWLSTAFFSSTSSACRGTVRLVSPALSLPCARAGLSCSAFIYSTPSSSAWRTSLSLDSCSPLPACSAPPRSPSHDHRRLYHQRVSFAPRALRDRRNRGTTPSRGASDLLQRETCLAK